MPKPIFLVGFPESASLEDLHIAQSRLDRKIDDYHVIVYRSYSKQMEFHCFHEKDIEEIELEKLKQIVGKVSEQTSNLS